MSRNVGKMWWPGSLPGDLKSHDDKLLKEHLQNVASISRQLAEINKIDVDTDLLEFVGWTHDLGKVHPTFQAYLEGRSQGVEHSRPSSYFTLSLTKCLMAAELVRRHHTGLQDIADVKSFWAGDRLDYAVINETMRSLLPDWPCLLSEDEWYDFVDWINLDLKVDETEWLKWRTLYSMFITADRMDALGVSHITSKAIPSFTLPNFKSDTKMNKWRTLVRKTCLQGLPGEVKPGIYTLTLPTGSGKTVTGLQIASDFASKIGANSIIYALPFIAIVEQNAKVAREVFGKDVQEDHSGMFAQQEEHDEASQGPLQRMSSLFRYWTEPVVVTTLAALWNACFEPRANASMNFHRLHNSVVVLDEPQSIRPELWKGFGKTMELLAEQCGTVFLLMTATQPHISKGTELAAGIQPFSESRHTYEYLDEKIPIEDLPYLLESHLPVDDGCGLVVLNTKKSAFQAWRELRDRLDGPVLFLSRSMAPLHRRATLKQLKELRERGCKHHLVATQVVEAGVDLDFDWVYRDLGPLDSVIQVAGRCNRHLNPDVHGRVLVAELRASNDRSFHSYVYSKILTLATREILSRYRSFSEHEVPAMVDEYYKRILERIHTQNFFDNDIRKGHWGSLPKLIEEQDFYEVPVFVELDDGLLPLLEELEQIEWSYETQERIRYLRNMASQYMIEIPLKSLYQSLNMIGRIETTSDVPPLRPVLNGRYWLLSRDAIGEIYHPEAGYIHPGLQEDDIGNYMH